MNKPSVVTTRIDPELKSSTDAIFSDLGITSEQAIIMFLKQVELDKAIPFELKLPNAPKARIAGLHRGQSIMSDNFDEALL